MTYLADFADFAAKADPGPEVRAKTALILADTIGAIVGGAAEPEVERLRSRLVADAAGQCTVIGTTLTANAATAALLNGTAGTTLEMDEGNQFAKGHPAIHAIPAILAEATRLIAAGREISGRDLLNACCIGYEAAARVGIASQLRGSMHPHGTWGAIGAAVGVLRLRGAAAGDIVEAMNMAASLGSTTSRRTMLEGGTVRNVFAGVSNQMGLLAADLSAVGYNGDADGVGHVFGKVAGDGFNPDAMTDQLGERWEVMRNYFKMHSCCRFNHAALDALDLIRADTPELDPAQVEAVAVDSYMLAAELDDPAPANVLAAKFSVPFAIATSLANGGSDVQSFTNDKVADPVIRALAAKVSIREDASMSAKLPDLRPAKVVIRLTDGRELEASVETNQGDWSAPYPPEQIEAKYMSLTTRLWSADAAKDVWSDILSLDAAPSVAPVLGKLGA